MSLGYCLPSDDAICWDEELGDPPIITTSPADLDTIKQGPFAFGFTVLSKAWLFSWLSFVTRA